MTEERDKELKIRIRIVFVFILSIGALLIARLFFLQVVNGSEYKALATGQQNFSGELPPRRGEIYLREKEGELITLASTKEGYFVFINPQKIQDPEATFEKLNALIPVDREDFLYRASKEDDPYEVVVRKVDRATALEINKLKIEGIGTSPEEWRSYPAGNLASHVVGFLGYKKDEELEGRYGLERYYEDVLRGRSGYIEADRSGTGILLQLGRKLFTPPKEGYDIVLTLEPNVQTFLEQKLAELNEEYRPTKGGGIIMEPSTGKILAMASFPGFDPNAYGEEKSLEVFINPLTENIYELGSVFKPLTMAAAINEKAVTPETTYLDQGYLKLDGYTIRNFDGEARGRVDMQRVLEESLNTGAAFAAGKLGKEKLREYFFDFGLGDKTDITLPGEVAGNLANLNSSREVEFATASFGQGIAVTPIEFTSAVSILANGGKLMRPYLVERVVRPGEEDIVAEPKMIREVITPETSETISRMLVKVVDDALLGGMVKFPRWTSAAKTGTAQIPLKGARGYSETEFLHSFFGYAPGFDAKFMLFLFVEKPQGVRYASQSLGPYFQEIMQFLLTYYNVPPDR